MQREILNISNIFVITRKENSSKNNWTIFFFCGIVIIGENKMRIMCLDVGRARIGIAQSDPMQIIASPLEVLKRTNSINADAKHVAELIKENNVGLLVVGLPLKLDGSAGESAEMARELAEKIQKFTDVTIEFQDERLSTVSAERILIEGNVRREKRKGVVDKIAATIILQNYLDRLAYKR